MRLLMGFNAGLLLVDAALYGKAGLPWYWVMAMTIGAAWCAYLTWKGE